MHSALAVHAADWTRLVAKDSYPAGVTLTFDPLLFAGPVKTDEANHTLALCRLTETEGVRESGRKKERRERRKERIDRSKEREMKGWLLHQF